MVSSEVSLYPGPESACKLGAAIFDYGEWEANLANDVFEEEPGQFRPANILLAREVDWHRCQSVHHNENPGVARCH